MMPETADGNWWDPPTAECLMEWYRKHHPEFAAEMGWTDDD